MVHHPADPHRRDVRPRDGHPPRRAGRPRRVGDSVASLARPGRVARAPDDIGGSSGARGRNSASPRAAMSFRAADGSATAACATSLRAARSSRRRPASAASSRREKVCSHSRRLRISSPPSMPSVRITTDTPARPARSRRTSSVDKVLGRLLDRLSDTTGPRSSPAVNDGGAPPLRGLRSTRSSAATTRSSGGSSAWTAPLARTGPATISSTSRPASRMGRTTAPPEGPQAGGLP